MHTHFDNCVKHLLTLSMKTNWNLLCTSMQKTVCKKNPLKILKNLPHLSTLDAIMKTWIKCCRKLMQNNHGLSSSPFVYRILVLNVY